MTDESTRTPAQLEYAKVMAEFDRLCDLSRAEQSSALADLAHNHPERATAIGKLLQADRADLALTVSSSDGPVAATSAAELGLVAMDIGQIANAALQEFSPAPSTASLVGTLYAERYDIVAAVGEGGAGDVYKARDRQRDATVALKILRAHNASANQLRRFRREFRTIGRLDHPGIVRVFDEGAGACRDPAGGLGGESRYIAMEWMAGGDLTQYVGAPLAVILPLVAKVADALDVVHRHRIVHRDLKPANVLLDGPPGPGVTPKLADFGIVKEVGPGLPGITNATKGTAQTADGAIIGTIDYLAPEQATGAPVDPRADLYALGCMLFELVSGAPPFEGPSYERLTRRVTHPAPRLCERVPEIPASLDGLVARLLMTAPQERPQSAFAVGGELLDIIGELGLSHPDSLDPQRFSQPAKGGFLYAAGCLGRSQELKLLDRHAEAQNLAKSTASVIVSGPAGQGKSTLVATFAHALQANGWTTFRVALRSEQPTPLAPFPELLRRMGATTHQALSTTGELASAKNQRFGAYGDGSRSALDTLLGQILERLDEQTSPTAIVAEDMHSASADALEVWGALDRRIRQRQASQNAPPLPCLVVATTRPHALEHLIDHVPGAPVVTLGPLGSEATGSIVCRMLGVAPAQVPAGLLEDLVEATEGNPLLVVSAVAGLVESGTLRRARDRWTVAESGSRPQLSNVLTAALHERLATLDLYGDGASTLLALQGAAVFGMIFDEQAFFKLGEAMDIPPERCTEALDQSMTAGIILANDDGPVGSLRFAHALFVDAILEKASVEPTLLMRLHDAAAQWWLGEENDARDGARAGRSVSVAYHRIRGSVLEVALNAALQAAEEASRAYDYGAAAKHLEAALARPDANRHGLEAPIAERVSATREALADALVPLGDVSRAVALLGVVRDEAIAPVARARMLRKTGVAYLRTDQAALGLDALRAALVTLGGGIPKGRVGRIWAMVRDFGLAGLNRLWRRWSLDPALEERAVIQGELALLNRWVDLYGAGAHVAAFGRLSERLQAPRYRTDAYAFTMFFYAFLGMRRLSERCQAQGMALATAANDDVGVMRLALMRGGTELMLNADPAAARRHLDEAVTIAERLADPFLLSFTMLGRGWAALLVADMPTAAADLNRAHDQAMAAGTAWVVADARIGTAIVDLMQARFDDALEASEAILSADIRLAFPVLEAIATEVVGATALLQGRYHDAVTRLSRAMDVYKVHGLRRGWGFLVPMEYAEALCCLADEAGEAFVPELDAELKRAGRWTKTVLGNRRLYRGCVAMMKGIRASRRGKVERARTLFTRAGAERRDNTPDYIDTWIAVRTALERSRWGDDPASVNAALDAVAARYEELELAGMSHWLRGERERRGLTP